MIRSNYHRKGFTIVELLIVIVVIGILAAITIVAYNGIQSRARDTTRKQDLAQLAKSTQLYSVDKGDFAEANCGNGSGSGWLGTDYDAGGPYVSINVCLTTGNYLSKVLTDPTGAGSCSGTAATCFAYMKASCVGATYYMAHLETIAQTATDTDGTCQPAWDTNYGMNYVVKVSS